MLPTFEMLCWSATFKQDALTIHVITYKDSQRILLHIAPHRAHPAQHALIIRLCYHTHGALIFIELLMHPSANTYRSSHHLDYHIHAFVHINTQGVGSLLDQVPMQVLQNIQHDTMHWTHNNWLNDIFWKWLHLHRVQKKCALPKTTPKNTRINYLSTANTLSLLAFL